MSLGEYETICKGYIMRKLDEAKQHRSLLAAIVREKPTKLYVLPGDFDDVPDPMTKEEIEQRIKWLGNTEVMKLHGVKDG